MLFLEDPLFFSIILSLLQEKNVRPKLEELLYSDKADGGMKVKKYFKDSSILLELIFFIRGLQRKKLKKRKFVRKFVVFVEKILLK
jgi:hypothetical protein